jgi:hypothetical protein
VVQTLCQFKIDTHYPLLTGQKLRFHAVLTRAPMRIRRQIRAGYLPFLRTAIAGRRYRNGGTDITQRTELERKKV